jgi:hypothetical protein
MNGPARVRIGRCENAEAKGEDPDAKVRMVSEYFE